MANTLNSEKFQISRHLFEYRLIWGHFARQHILTPTPGLPDWTSRFDLPGIRPQKADPAHPQLLYSQLGETMRERAKVEWRLTRLNCPSSHQVGTFGPNCHAQ